MILRVVVAFVFLAVATWFQLHGSQKVLSIYPLYAIVAVIGFLTILYAVVIMRIERLVFFGYIQSAADIAVITVIVYATGGIDSYLSILYHLSVIGSAALFGKRGGYYSASLATITFTSLLSLDFHRMLPFGFRLVNPSSGMSWENVATTISINALGFFTVAYLTGYLAGRTLTMEKKLEEKEIDYGRLETLNRLIIDNITSGIMTLDENRRITSFNRAATGITGYALKDVYYKNAEEVFPSIFGESATHASPGLLSRPPGAEAISGGTGRGGASRIFGDVTRSERTFRSKEGKDITIGFMISPGKGGDMTSIVIFQDLTRLKALEEMIRRDDRLKALGELSAAIAHEIRNPLASISGSIQVLRQDLALDGDKSHLMEIVLRETERLNSLITDFLLFARPAMEKKQWFDLAEAIRETLDVLGNNPDIGGRIKVENRIDGHIFLEGNRRQMVQVFWNLFLNAVSAMPEGGALTVSSRIIAAGASMPLFNRTDGGASPRSLKAENAVEIDISDTGGGIKPENIGRVFDPFFSTKDSGTGLGLSLAHRIIENHGGTITVKSPSASGGGEGTTFRVTLPLTSEEAATE